jgi:CheY-like chemotaxis protein
MLLANKHIFIVEDNQQNRVVFQMALLVTGAMVSFERGGSHAIARLKELTAIDIIILDLMLRNDVSGYEIFEHLRSMPKYDHVPIVAVSAAEPAIALPKTQQMGFSGFIAKPINDELFPMQLCAILSGEQVWYTGSRV